MIPGALAYMPSCTRPEVRLSLDQRTLCSNCCEKNALWRARYSSRFCTAQKQDTFGAYDQTYTFAQLLVQTKRWS